MWQVEYTKRFLKELSKLPKGIQTHTEKIVFDELLSTDPFPLWQDIQTNTKSELKSIG